MINKNKNKNSIPEFLSSLFIFFLKTGRHGKWYKEGKLNKLYQRVYGTKNKWIYNYTSVKK